MFSGRIGPVEPKTDKKWFLKILPRRAGFAVPGPYMEAVKQTAI